MSRQKNPLEQIQKKELHSQLRIFSAIMPGAGDSSVILKKELTPKEPGHEEHSHGQGAHGGHPKMSKKDFNKLVWTMTRKGALGIFGVLIGVWIAMNVPGFRTIGLILSFPLGMLFYILGGKEPEGHH